MSSIARQLRPVASRLIKRSAIPSSWQARSFSATSTSLVKKYTKDHEWIDITPGDKTGTIGISKYAAHALGDVVYIELPTTDLETGAGDAIGAVESVKSASDVNAPITCKITEVNTTLEETPGTINKAPEDLTASGGWIARVEVGDVGVKEAEGLMSEEEYKAFTEEEEGDH